MNPFDRPRPRTLMYTGGSVIKSDPYRTYKPDDRQREPSSICSLDVFDYFRKTGRENICAEAGQLNTESVERELVKDLDAAKKSDQMSAAEKLRHMLIVAMEPNGFPVTSVTRSQAQESLGYLIKTNEPFGLSEQGALALLEMNQDKAVWTELLQALEKWETPWSEKLEKALDLLEDKIFTTEQLLSSRHIGLDRRRQLKAELLAMQTTRRAIYRLRSFPENKLKN